MLKLLFSPLLFVIAFALNLLDRILFYIVFYIKGAKALPYDLKKFGSFPIKAKPVENAEAKPGETKPYRSLDAYEAFKERPVEGIDTLGELFSWCVKQYPKKDCLGSRPLLRIHHENRTEADGSEKVFSIPEFGEIVWETYEKVDQRVSNIASGIVQFTKLNSGERFGIFEDTCQEWMMTAQACLRYGITIITVYANLGEEGILQAFQETEITAIFTSEKQLPNFKEYVKKLPKLKYIIYNKTIKSDKGENVVVKELESETKLKIISLEDLEALGASASPAPAPRQIPTRETLALIMYTSGTTGKPKGVMITHKNILAAIAGIKWALGDDPNFKPIILGYLPLAHILELVAENYAFTMGGAIGYGSPRTLTDKGAKPVGDLAAVRPTVMVGVPKVWDTVKKGGKEKIEKSGPIAKWLFETAYAARKRAIASGKDTPLWDFLVFKNFKQIIGGRIALVLSGGAPLSEPSHEFMRICLGCSVIQGYGLTETCAALAVQGGYHEYAPKRGGPPVACAEVKLVSVDEMGYKVTDKPNPRGEICVRGPNVTLGYYLQPEKTKEDFKEDGWFHTGDVGEIHPDGSISIVDRKKNLVKLDTGEYVALEKLESVYSNSPFISPNGICVYADGLKSFCVAVAVPQVTYLTEWAKKNNITQSNNLLELIKSPVVREAVLKSLQEEAKRNKLLPYEIVKDVRLFAEEWLPENGLLTAAQKLKRNAIAERYKDAINEMYKK